MKLIEAIKNVQRTKENAATPDYSEFCQEVGIMDCSGWKNEFCERLRGYYLMKWYCTDQYVGLIAYYLDNEPVAVSMQTARKSSTSYEFINKESAEKVREFILSLQEEEPFSFKLMDLNEKIDKFYNVDYTGQLLTKEGFVKGKPCKIINDFREDYIAKKAIVEFCDGTQKTINIKDFKIPLSLV